MEVSMRILGRAKAREQSVDGDSGASYEADAGREAEGTSTSLAPGQAVDERPYSVYEVVTRQMLEQVKADIAEVKTRVNALLWLVVGAVVTELVMRVVK